ncbi:MAG: TonB-dependent receptor [Ideonella sp.]|nr:TonB-dependent receptor [Ideonella sp.]
MSTGRRLAPVARLVLAGGERPPAGTAPAPAFAVLALASAAAVAQGGSPALPPAAEPAPAAVTAVPAADPPPAAPAPPGTARLPPVQVRGSDRSPTDERRTSTATKIVVGREEIEQFGDSSLGDVIRRLPGVTIGGRPGRGGELRMRGMGSGYTQVLIDGQRVPPGFSIDQLSPEAVERIEVLRAPTAETGTRAVAGTINIVLREPLRQLSDDLRTGFQSERGVVSPGVSWVRNGTLGERGTYNLTLNATAPRQRTDTATRSTTVDGVASPLDEPVGGTTVLDHVGEDTAASSRRSLFFSPRLQWRLGPGEQVGLQPFVVRNTSGGVSEGTLEAVGGTTPAPYAERRGETASDSTVARLGASGAHRVAPTLRAEWRASAGGFAQDSRSAQDQFDDTGALGTTQRSSTRIRDRSWNAFGKLTHRWTPGGSADAQVPSSAEPAGEPHSLVFGWEAEGLRRDETAPTVVNGVAVAGGAGDELAATSQRFALFVQDEWEPAANWSAYLGLRAETIRTRSEATSSAPAVDTTSQVVSPLAQVVWRFAAPRRDQLRLALTQSYRAPTLQNLVASPSLNTLFPAPGPNTAANPDRAGNPGLLPERANGLDLAFERYLDAGGVLSVNLFWRQLRDVIRNVTAFEAVPWASAGRWVSRPRNVGDAVTRGLEFDAKARLSDLLPGAVPVNLRANLSLFDSDVASVPGPDNRIDQQPRLTGNLGADHRWRGTPWTLGGTLAFTPGYRTRLTETQGQQVGDRRVVDAYLLWTRDSALRVRLTLSNLAPLDAETVARIVDGTQTQSVRSVGRSDPVLGLRVEMRL